MASAAVKKEAVQKSAMLCSKSIEALKKASHILGQKCASAGATWKDNKYFQLCAIIEECRGALGDPVDQLSGCIASLQELGAAIGAYEDVSF